MAEAELKKKLGGLYGKYEVHQHDWKDKEKPGECLERPATERSSALID